MLEILQRLFGGVVNEQNYAEFLKEFGRRFVPKNDYNARLDELRGMQGELAAAREKAERSDELAAERDELAAALQRLRGECEALLRRTLVEHEAEKVLLAAGARNLAAVRALLKLDALEQKMAGEMKAEAEASVERGGAGMVGAAASYMEGSVEGSMEEFMAACLEKLGLSLQEQVRALREDAGTAFLFAKPLLDGSADGASWVGFVPAAAGDLAWEGADGEFRLRLDLAREQQNGLEAIKIKQQAALQGVYL